MYDALLNGRLGGAGLDAFAAEPPDPTLPVYHLPNVVVTPHVSGCTVGTSRKRAAAAAENVNRIARGQEPLYRVDWTSPRTVGAPTGSSQACLERFGALIA